MKNIFKILLLIITPAGVFLSCTKKENKIYYEGGTPPVLSSSVTGNIPLSFLNKDNTGLTLMWTNPNYNFTTGLSSQDVAYQVEIDTTGANFASPLKLTFGVSKDLSKSFTQGELNNYLFGQMGLVPGMAHNIEIRVKSSLTNNNAVIASNVLKFTVTPYTIPPKVTQPVSGTLFIVGSATPGGSSNGWDNPISRTVAVQQFTKVSSTLYTITLPLIGGGEYKLIGVNGSWNDQWSIAKQDDPAEIYGGDFVFNGANILAPPTSGTYKIDVNFQSGTFTVTKM